MSKQPPSEPIAFRAPPQLKQLVEAAADYANVTPSTWLQQALTDYLQEYVKEHGAAMLAHAQVKRDERVRAEEEAATAVEAYVRQFAADSNKP